MKKRINLLYFSATGTTAQTVKAIAKGIGGDATVYDITLPAGRQREIAFGSDDLVIIGVPVYMGRIPASVTEFFLKVKGSNTPAVFVAVYGNRDYDDALLEMKDLFEKNGFIGIAGGAFIGEHSSSAKIATGRPDEQDKKIAEEFGVKIRNKLEAAEDLPNMPKLSVRGNFPYRTLLPSKPSKPDTSNECTNCGICAKYCPMGAISFEDAKDIDDTKCMRCSSCVKRCPVSAKSFNSEENLKRVETMIAAFGGIRKEPEMFI